MNTRTSLHRSPRSIATESGQMASSSSTAFENKKTRQGATSVPHRMSIVESKRNLTPIKLNGSKTAIAPFVQGGGGNNNISVKGGAVVAAATGNRGSKQQAANSTGASTMTGRVTLPPLIVAHKGGPTNANGESNSNNGIAASSIYVCKGNNDQLIRTYFSKLKWTILDQSMRFYTKFQFKWVECIPEIDWPFFNPATQIVNHIQNIQIISTKAYLVQTVKDFEYKEKALASSFGKMHSSRFMPLTFRLDTTREDITQEEQAFLNHKTTGLWINKPTSNNCGKGISMIADMKKFKEEFMRQKNSSGKGSKSSTTATTSAKFGGVFHKKSIIQRYLEKPLLLDKRKFDMRVYVFIVSTSPLFVLFNPGYLRLSMNEYNLENADDVNQKYTHLTNAAIQKKHPDFASQKENTIWSIQKFHEYIKTEQGVTQEQIDKLSKKIKEIFAYVMRAAEKKIDKKQGCFELMGCDILLGSDLKPYLIEMNSNPALYLDTVVQSQVIPGVVRDALDIVMHVHSKQNSVEEILRDPNFDYKGFEPLINDATGFSFLPSALLQATLAAQGGSTPALGSTTVGGKPTNKTVLNNASQVGSTSLGNLSKPKRKTIIRETETSTERPIRSEEVMPVKAKMNIRIKKNVERLETGLSDQVDDNKENQNNWKEVRNEGGNDDPKQTLRTTGPLKEVKVQAEILDSAAADNEEQNQFNEVEKSQSSHQLVDRSEPTQSSEKQAVEEEEDDDEE